jgi:hypothetical protein
MKYVLSFSVLILFLFAKVVSAQPDLPCEDMFPCTSMTWSHEVVNTNIYLNTTCTYPCPVTISLLSINSDKQYNTLIVEIIDSHGIIISKDVSQFIDNKLTIDLSSYISGYYYYRISDSHKRIISLGSFIINK